MRQYKNPGVHQSYNLNRCYRDFAQHVPSGAIVIPRDDHEEKILNGLVARGLLVVVDDKPSADALFATAKEWEWHGTPIDPAPILRNVSRRELAIQDEQGEIIEVILSGGVVIGERYLQFRRPNGPLHWTNRPLIPHEVVYDPFAKNF
jgi:hypothetical protein